LSGELKGWLGSAELGKAIYLRLIFVT
jgi:hypothetical protein